MTPDQLAKLIDIASDALEPECWLGHITMHDQNLQNTGHIDWLINEWIPQHRDGYIADNPGATQERVDLLIRFLSWLKHPPETFKNMVSRECSQDASGKWVDYENDPCDEDCYPVDEQGQRIKEFSDWQMTEAQYLEIMAIFAPLEDPPEFILWLSRTPFRQRFLNLMKAVYPIGAA